MSDEAVLKIAKLVLKRASITTLPTPVRKVAAKYTDVENIDIPFDLDGICISKPKGKSRILVNNTVTPSRKRFTIAHELGHIVIPWHTGIIVDYSTSEYDDYSIDYAELEHEANLFAAELLLPSDIIVERLSNLSAENDDWSIFIQTIANEAKVSLLTAIIKIFAHIIDDFVFIVVDEQNMVIYSGKSEGSKVSVPKNGEMFKSDEYLPFNSKKWIINTTNNTYYIINTSLNVSLAKSEDTNWKKIIDIIAIDNIEDEEERKHVINSLNGVVGYFNSRNKGKGISYSIYYSKLYAAIQSHVELLPLYGDERFPDYLKNKISSMIESE